MVLTKRELSATTTPHHHHLLPILSVPMASPPLSVDQVARSFCATGRAAAAAAAAKKGKSSSSTEPVDKGRLRKIELQQEAARAAAAARGETAETRPLKMTQCAVCKKSKKHADMFHYVGTAPRVASVQAEFVSFCGSDCAAHAHEVLTK